MKEEKYIRGRGTFECRVSKERSRNMLKKSKNKRGKELANEE